MPVAAPRRCRRRRVTALPSQSTPSGNRSDASASCVHGLLAGERAVRDGDALADVGGDRLLPLEHRVDVRTRRPRRRQAAPRRTAGSRRRASGRGARAGWRSRSSRSARAVVRHRRSPPFLIALTTFVTAGSPMNTWNGTTGLSGARSRGPVGQPGVADDHVGVGGISLTGVCSTVTFALLQLPSQLAGQHDAAAHARVAGDDDLLDVLAVRCSVMRVMPLW